MTKILNSKLIICDNINMDKGYKNVINYTESQMVSLCYDNSIKEYSTFSFIRERNALQVEESYGNIIKANYIAFQNPDYSGKWFFAFIDEVNYKGDKNTEIVFTIDVWSTWNSYWSEKTCFTIREHVDDDNPKLNTYPENLETGDYIVNREHQDLDYGDFNICVAVSEDLIDDTELEIHKSYNGVVSGLTYIVLQNESDVNYLILQYNTSGKIDAISSLFMIPSKYVPAGGWKTSPTGLVHYKYIEDKDGAFDLGSVSITKRTFFGEVFDGEEKTYTPKNKKLLNYPYMYLMATNNAGGDVIYRYEDFNSSEGQPTNSLTFKAKGTINAGCSIKIIPVNYKNHTGETNYAYGFNGAKIPLGGWINDVYANWLRQNGLNIALNITSSVIGGTAGAMMGDATAVAGSTINIANTLASVYKNSLIPNQAEGNVNSSDVMYSLGKINPSFYQMTIKIEYAKMIDEYFTRFGYMVNRLKKPNITGRQYFNYIQIGEGEDIILGDVPTNYAEKINDIARKGVTIWHNHINVGNFDLDNSI